MLISKTELLKKINARIAEHKTAHDENVKALKAEYDAEQKDWVDNIAPKWIAHFTKLSAKVKSGKRILYNEVIEGAPEKLPYYEHSHNKFEAPKYNKPSDLFAMKELVEMSSEENINITKLGGKDIVNVLNRYAG